MNTPTHPKTAQFARRGLIKNLQSLEELESRILSWASQEPEGVRETFKGDALEVFAEAYFAVKRPNDFTKIWSKFLPWHVIDALNIPAEDHGIDGVLFDRLECYAPYQVKFRPTDYRLKWNECSNLFGLSDSDAISQKIIFTNCRDVPRVAKQRKNGVFILRDTLKRLTPEDFSRLDAWLDKQVIELRRPLELYDYQEEAVTKIISKLRKASRTQCRMACGTGKTFVALGIVKELSPARTLVLVPTLALLGQIQERWASKWEFDPIYVCSDLMGEAPKDNGDEEDIDEAKLEDFSFAVTLSPAPVRKWLDNQSDLPKIAFCTYQSSWVIEKALNMGPQGDSFDVAIFDEAHRTTGWSGSKFSLALNQKRIRIRKRIFFTASPRYYEIEKGKLKGKIYSMHNNKVYGDVAHELTYGEAADSRRRIIVPPRLIITEILDEQLHSNLRQRAITRVDGQFIGTSQVSNQLALSYSIREFGHRKIFTYHKTIRIAESFVKDAPEGVGRYVPEFLCLTINSEMGAKQRKARFDSFEEADRAIMSSVNILNEGVDAPDVDCVAILTPKKRHGNICQIMGRGCRKVEGKEFFHVLLPVYREPGETIGQAAARSKFDTILSAIRMLVEEGLPLSDIVRDMEIRQLALPKGGNDARPGEQVLTKPPLVYLRDLKKRISLLALEIDAFEAKWQENYEKSKRRKEEKGVCNCPSYEEPSLHRWQVHQRVQYKKKRLAKRRIELLNQIGFCWDDDQARWDSMIEELKAYYARTGNWQIPQNTRLGRWVAGVRQLKRKNKLSDKRIAELDALGFPWEPRDAIKERQLEIVKEIGKAFKKNGNFHIPPKYRGQATRWRGLDKEGKLDLDIKAALVEINFIFDPKEEDERKWEEMMQHVEAGERRTEALAWINNQRVDYKSNRLRADRKERLLRAGVLLDDAAAALRDIQMEAWLEKREQYRRYIVKTGDTLALHAPKKLKNWAGNQRAASNRKELPQKKLDLLDEVDFDWGNGPKDPNRDRCKYGHPYTPENTRWYRGARRCVMCHRLYQRAAYRKQNGSPGKSETHCKYGHPWTEENTYWTKAGHKSCKECHRIYAREAYRNSKRNGANGDSE